MVQKKKTTSFLYDSKGQRVIVERPNKWASIAFVGWAWARSFEDSGFLEFVGRAPFYLAGLYWAYLEVTSGRSQFRRTLGLVVGVLLMISLIQQFI
jgi:hypothetical protein